MYWKSRDCENVQKREVFQIGEVSNKRGFTVYGILFGISELLLKFWKAISLFLHHSYVDLVAVDATQ